MHSFSTENEIHSSVGPLFSSGTRLGVYDTICFSAVVGCGTAGCWSAVSVLDGLEGPNPANHLHHPISFGFFSQKHPSLFRPVSRTKQIGFCFHEPCEQLETSAEINEARFIVSFCNSDNLVLAAPDVRLSNQTKVS